MRCNVNARKPNRGAWWTVSDRAGPRRADEANIAPKSTRGTRLPAASPDAAPRSAYDRSGGYHVHPWQEWNELTRPPTHISGSRSVKTDESRTRSFFTNYKLEMRVGGLVSSFHSCHGCTWYPTEA